MDLNSLITGPARAGIALGRRVGGILLGRSVSVAGGVLDRVRGGSELDDATLARKVEAEIFRSRRVAKGKVDVNVAEGVVWLRGEARTPDLIQELESKAAAIPEVKRVENLLRLPRTPAPTRTDTPATQRRTRSTSGRTKPKSAARARKQAGAPKRATAERRTAPAEPSPVELARERKGRQPAPLGAPAAAATGEPDDTTITRKVETELFREGFAPKGKITVSTAGAVVFLRGEADTADRIRELEAKAAGVPDVKRVENELRVAAPPTSPGGDASGGAEEREWSTRRFSADETTQTGEPTPRELADRGEGRRPAPLGAPVEDARGGAEHGSGESPAAPFPTPSNGNGNGGGAPGASGEETAS